MIALISDIHGNYEALKSVFSAIEQLDITSIYCLGDVVGYYSQVNECCHMLRERNVRCVMGNHDWYMVSGTMCPRSHSVNDCLTYQRKIITKDNLQWLESFPVIIKQDGLMMLHGGWNNPIDEYLNIEDDYFSNIEGNFFASGHTHVQMIVKNEYGIYCNPGAVGQPRDGDNRAAFATFDGMEFKLHRVKYDIEKVGTLMEHAGFEQYYYGCLRDASKNLHR